MPKRTLLLLAIVALAALAYFGFRLSTPKPPVPPAQPAAAPPDMAAVAAANNRGIGYIEQFKYPQAAEAFEEVVRRAPDWLPGRINLALALLNTNADDNLRRARALYSEVLRAEPDNPFAHFGLGVILRHQGNPEEHDAAAEHFEAVLRKDPDDAASWYWLGTLAPPGSDRAADCFRHAARLDPNLTGAIYGLFTTLRRQDPARAAQALAEYQALRDERFDSATRGNPIALKYGEMGRYGVAVGGPQLTSTVGAGPLPLFLPAEGFHVQLAPLARWARKSDFQSSQAAVIQRLVRSRFGATIVILDYNRDGRLDLFLPSAVVDRNGIRDLLLRNDGNGIFTDVTEEAGLAGPRASLGCCVADVDNDGYPDLLITGVGRVWLFRNAGGRRFEDITQAADSTSLRGVFLGASFVDLDQDGDLDLLVARYARDEAEALRGLQSGAAKTDGGLCVYLNVGEALPQRTGGGTEELGLLRPRFRPAYTDTARLPSALLPAPGHVVAAAAESVARTRLLGTAAPTVAMALSDIDHDRDLDLLVLADGHAPTVVWNDRLLRFHRAELPPELLSPSTPPAQAMAAWRWNGALVLDADHDGRSDLFLVSPDRPPVLLLNRGVPGQQDLSRIFERGVTDAPPLLQAQAVDIDLDGLTDIVGLSHDGRPVLLHNDGQRLAKAALGDDWPSDLQAIVAADFDGDGFPDLLAWSDAQGLVLRKGSSNGNRGLPLELTGRRGTEPGGVKVRTNAQAFGVRLIAQAGERWTGAEYTTLSAGLGQSLAPLLLGLGPNSQADVLRLRWPDGVWQAELHLPAGQPCRVAETNRKETSCPILFTWNGQRFEFITDFLGAGSVGEPTPGGGHRPPRPEESIKIEPGQLVAKDGYYTLKIAEPMNEVTFLDRLQLVAIDHPPFITIFPDERFADSGPPVTQDLLGFSEQVFPVRARDHRGRDVTQILARRDRVMVDDFAHRSWLGFAEDHWVELDFGDRLSKFGPQDKLFLCLAGWTDYAYPESIWAAAQAGVGMEGPVLERLGAGGRWESLGDAGLPAGLPRMMTLDVSGKLTGPRCVLRLRTNLEVYWDQAFVGYVGACIKYDPDPEVEPSMRLHMYLENSTRLEVKDAVLGSRPYMKEYSPDGKQPTLYDYDQVEPLPVSRLSGRLTRFGDVTELLRNRDDRFVIFGPGDELTVRFDARHLSPPSAEYPRSFVLRAWGYCKDCSPFTEAGETVGPLPFRGMSDYPYAPPEHYPDDAAHRAYQAQYNTRPTGAASPEK